MIEGVSIKIFYSKIIFTIIAKPLMERKIIALSGFASS